MGVSIRGSFSLPTGRVVIGKVDERPFQGSIKLKTDLMPEHAAQGFLVSYLYIEGGEEGETYSFALDDDAGGRFKINGNRLEAGPVPTDHATASSHTIQVRAFDSSQREASATFIIDVSSLSTPTTWNPFDKNAEAIIKGDNLVLATNVSGVPGGHVRSVASMTRGKWYFEVSTTGVDGAIGLSIASAVFTPYFTDPGTIALDTYNGWVRRNATIGTIAPWRGGVAGLAYDADEGRVWFHANGNWGSGHNPVTGQGGFSFAPGAPVFAYGYVFRQINMTARFGASGFVYPVPDGFHPGIFQQ